MADYVASMMDAATGGENKYPFQGPDDLLDRTPVRIIRHFMEIVDRELLPAEQIDYELNAAMKNRQIGVVTAIGSLIRENGGEIPFLLMISKKS
ncbi:hypothetical protein [Amorphus orientalis]|uniref:Uncharacterized protein n=1 Tax=Amorphus orientalis TaxID=649198 RepID=A0AAE4ARD0_9HYPH|nr:hypothetical protein [Amorphus orientalis]MDQ0314082.1 hypothetical protein [Amorphus orientalis]